jgi:hypothetical protein
LNDRQAKNVQLVNKSNSKLTVLFSHATKNVAIGEQKQLKIDCFCSAAQRKILELVNRSNSKLFGRAAKTFAIGEQK